MSIRLNVNDVFEIAQQIEKKGREFYQSLADMARDQVCLELFLDLADMEGEHVEVFAAIRDAAAHAPAKARAGALARHWPHIAREMLRDLDEDLHQRFSGRRAREDILRQAMEFEKDTIVFLTALRNLLAPAGQRRKIDRIIREELGHLVLLGAELGAPKRSGLSRPRTTH